MLKVLIADDHDFIREGLKLILREEYPSAHFGEAADTHTLIDKAGIEKWDIILSDISMPGGGGLFALEEITKRELDIPVLIVSMYPDKQYAEHARKAGAVGYLNKDSVTEHLVNAVQAILGGDEYYPVTFEKR